MLQLYFIRHGQSTNNAMWDDVERNTYLVQRAMDPDLTEKGKKQVRMVADFLSQPYQANGRDPQNRNGFGLTHLYCSLMVRAVKTGMAISEKLDLPLQAWPEIHETGGIFEIREGDEEHIYIGHSGHGRAFFQTHFPNLILPDDLPEEGWWNRDKEPREEYLKRARNIFARLCERHHGQEHRVGIVTHGGIFARILTIMFQVEAEKYWFLMNNCGISRIDVDDDGHVILAYMNRVDFLPDDLVT